MVESYVDVIPFAAVPRKSLDTLHLEQEEIVQTEPEPEQEEIVQTEPEPEQEELPEQEDAPKEQNQIQEETVQVELEQETGKASDKIASLAMNDHTSGNIEPSESEPEDQALNSKTSRLMKTNCRRQSQTNFRCHVVSHSDNTRFPNISETPEQNLSNHQSTSSSADAISLDTNENVELNDTLINGNAENANPNNALTCFEHVAANVYISVTDNSEDENQNNAMPCDEHMASNVDMSVTEIDAIHEPVINPPVQALLDHDYSFAQIKGTGLAGTKFNDFLISTNVQFIVH